MLVCVWKRCPMASLGSAHYTAESLLFNDAMRRRFHPVSPFFEATDIIAKCHFCNYLKMNGIGKRANTPTVLGQNSMSF